MRTGRNAKLDPRQGITPRNDIGKIHSIKNCVECTCSRKGPIFRTLCPKTYKWLRPNAPAKKTFDFQKQYFEASTPNLPRKWSPHVMWQVPKNESCAAHPCLLHMTTNPAFLVIWFHLRAFFGKLAQVTCKKRVNASTPTPSKSNTPRDAGCILKCV